MNPFGQIINLSDLSGIEPQKAGLGQLNNVDPKSLGIDFLQILGGKLSGELPFVFGEDAESIGSESVIPDKLLTDKSAETAVSDLTDELVNLKSGEFVSQNDLLDPLKIGSKQFLKIKTAEALNNTYKSLDIESVLSAKLNPKAGNLNTVSNNSIVSPELKIDNLNLNNIDLASAQSSSDNSDLEIRPTVLAEIDKELTPKNSIDLKTAGLIDKVAGSLNIKNIKLEKNSENNQADKEPVKLALPTKSYIKVTSVDGNSAASGNNKQFADARQNLFSGSTEMVSSESRVDDGEKVRLNNFEAIARVELDQKPAGQIETGRSTIQTRLISDIAPTLGNNVEKIELTETKMNVEPVKFVLPAELSGKTIKNNHTVMIRMEPDHLGPIRMTVSTYNDILTARLVVESPVARATIEANLNNLMEQLDRQGIKVDTFEVSVSGGEVGHDTKENRFAGSAGSARRNLERYKNSTAIDDVMAQRAQEHLYIEANGVNCFA